jgi:hypothetical protein
MVHYVESGHLVCLWKGHKAFLKEEEARARVREDNARRGYDEQSPVAAAP